MVCRLDEAIKQALAARSIDNDTDTVGYLDVRLDEKRRLAWRRDLQADLTHHPLCWDLLKVLIQSRGELVLREEIRKVWKGESAYDDDPSDSAVYDAIANLRALLKPLSIAIKSVRGRGYRLREC